MNFNQVWDGARAVARQPLSDAAKVARIMADRQARGANVVADYISPVGSTGFQGAMGTGMRGMGQVASEHPYLSAGSQVVGGYLANRFLGNPVGGVVDAATFGITNFRENEWENRGQLPTGAPLNPNVQYITDKYGNPVPSVSYPVPPLDAKQLMYERNRAQKNIAKDSMLLNQLDEIEYRSRFFGVEEPYNANALPY